MPKRRKKKKKKGRSTPSKKAKLLTTSQHTNLPRFLTMLVVGVAALLAFFFWRAIAGPPDNAQAAEEAPAPAPEAPGP